MDEFTSMFSYAKIYIYLDLFRSCLGPRLSSCFLSKLINPLTLCGPWKGCRQNDLIS